MSTTKKPSRKRKSIARKTAARASGAGARKAVRPASASAVQARRLLAAAKAAIKRRDFRNARILLLRVVALKGAPALEARRLLKSIAPKAKAPRTRKPRDPARRPRYELVIDSSAPSGTPRYLPKMAYADPTFTHLEASRGDSLREFGSPAPTDRGSARSVGSAPADVIVRRTPHLAMSNPSPAPGDRFTVVVFADRQAAAPGETVDEIVVSGPAGQTRYIVSVKLSCTAHFEIGDASERTLTIDVDQNVSTRAEFAVRMVRTAAAGERPALTAYFFYNDRACGKVTREVALGGTIGTVREVVAPTGNGGDGPPPAFEIDARAPLADIVVDVMDPHKTRQHLETRIRSRRLSAGQQPPDGTWDLPFESGKMVAAYMESFMSSKPKARLRRLKGAGEELFNAAPEGFKALYWKLVNQGIPPTSILITSEEPYIPWELMIPNRTLADGTIETRKALGVECAVGRWVHLDGHVAPRHTIALSDSYVLAPDYPGPSPKPLVNAAREVALVLGTVGGDRVAPVDVPTIDARFGASGRSLVHLVCHGADSPETGIQSIYLEGGDDELQSIEVGQIAGVVAALKKRPMVFLNACEVGRPAISLSGIGGFAQAFIKFGASSVIAPLWSVRDSIAFDVAERFYGAVKASRGSGRSYADILREIRALAYADDGGEDTYAAYCFYGDPTAVV